MTVIVILLLFLKNICIFFNDLFIRCYNSQLINPDYKKQPISISKAKANPSKSYRLSTNIIQQSNTRKRKFRGERENYR